MNTRPTLEKTQEARIVLKVTLDLFCAEAQRQIATLCAFAEPPTDEQIVEAYDTQRKQLGCHEDAIALSWFATGVRHFFGRGKQ